MPPPELEAPDADPGTGTEAIEEESAGEDRVGPGDGGPVDSTRPRPRPRTRRRRLAEAGIILAIAVLLAVALRLFVFQVFYVPSTSMLPTLRPGDRILVEKLSLQIERGDIIVFARPPREHCGGPIVPDLVKRVIGLPGDRIASRGNTVLIDGKPLAEPWLPRGTPLGPPIRSTVVPAGSYYVLGDNRATSCDSRYWGTVPRSLIVGKVVAVIWPMSRLHWF